MKAIKKKKQDRLAYLYRMVLDFVGFPSVELHFPIRNIGCVNENEKKNEME